MSGAGHFGERAYDRWFLLGEKRNEQLSLPEVRQYGLDSFGDPDYVSIYGLKPGEWYGIPYAESPVTAGRFSAPVPRASWDGGQGRARLRRDLAAARPRDHADPEPVIAGDNEPNRGYGRYLPASGKPCRPKTRPTARPR